MGCACSTSTSRTSPTTSKKGEDIRDFYKIGKLLGSGAFGQVRECTRREDGELFAVKIMERRSREVGHWSNENMFRREVQLLGILDNPHIVRYIDFYEDKHFLYAVIERCDGGELFEQIIKTKRFSEEDASYICRQMLLALSYVHSINIVHRDIKAENFLFKGKDIDSELKLIDFGMSARLSSKATYLSEVCGSPHYLSPELIKRQYNTQADMWALGVLIYLLIYGRYPFDGNGTDAIVKQILKKPIEYTAGNVTPSEECIDFMRILLERDPKKRVSAEEALQHKWVEDTEEHRQRRERARASAEAQPNLIECVRSAHRKVTLSKRREFSKKAEARLNQLLEKVERQWEEGKACGVRVSPLNQPPNIKPEFARHDKRMNTTPSRYVGGSLADLQALRRAIEQPDGMTTTYEGEAGGNQRKGSKELQHHYFLKDGLFSDHDDDCITGSTDIARTTADVSMLMNDGQRSSTGDMNSEDSNGGASTSSSLRRSAGDLAAALRNGGPLFDWDSAEKSIVDGQGPRRVFSDDVFTRTERRTVTVSVNQKDTVAAAAEATKSFEESAQHCCEPPSNEGQNSQRLPQVEYREFSKKRKELDYMDRDDTNSTRRSVEATKRGGTNLVKGGQLHRNILQFQLSFGHHSR